MRGGGAFPVAADGGPGGPCQEEKAGSALQLGGASAVWFGKSGGWKHSLRSQDHVSCRLENQKALLRPTSVLLKVLR